MPRDADGSASRAVMPAGCSVGSEVAILPIYARAASDNVGSLRVLEKTGFRVIDTEVSFAEAGGGEIEERILQLR